LIVTYYSIIFKKNKKKIPADDDLSGGHDTSIKPRPSGQDQNIGVFKFEFEHDGELGSDEVEDGDKKPA
jgi:hypothetical protein